MINLIPIVFLAFLVVWVTRPEGWLSKHKKIDIETAQFEWEEKRRKEMRKFSSVCYKPLTREQMANPEKFCDLKKWKIEYTINNPRPE